jgi:hypothetical protein
MATALTSGVITAIVTALLVAAVSMVIHITVYQCVYKPKLMIRNASTSCEPDVTYEIVDERPLVGAALEMKENEAYSVNKRVEGPEMKRNEAYGVAKPRGTKSSCSA